MTRAAKLQFLLDELPTRLAALAPDAPPQWGRMQGQQMVEHLIDAVLVAAGKIPVPQFTPAERLPHMLKFLHSDAPMTRNLPNPLIPEVPRPARLPDMDMAVAELRRALDAFVAAYGADEERLIVNPFFGPLDYDGQLQLLVKHGRHHLEQFGV